MADLRGADARLAELLERATPMPSRELEGAAIRTNHRRRRRWVAPVAAALVIILVATALTLISRRRHDEHSALRPGGAASANAQRRRETVSSLERLLDAFAVPSNWRRSTLTLSKDLALPHDDPASYLVRRARLWVTSDPANTAMDHLSAHLPPDVTPGNSVGATADFASALFTPLGEWSRSAVYAGMSISVVVERLRPGSVGVDIEASAYWLPVRGPAETIPATVTGARVTIMSGEPSKIVYRGALDRADARALARQINALPVTYQSIGSLCPVSGRSQSVVFTSPIGLQRVTVHTFCPSGVFVESRGPGMGISLVAGRTFDTVLTMLHLPADFGRR